MIGPLPRQNSFLSSFLGIAQERPEDVAVVHDGGEVTYGELFAGARALAADLTARGMGRDHPVGVVGNRTPEALVGTLGVLLAGAAYVPMDPSYPRERIRFMLRESGIQLLLVPEGFRFSGPSEMKSLVVPPVQGNVAVSPAEVAWGAPAPSDLAYVLYTSGSTGRPKGVAMVHEALDNLIQWQVERSSCGPGDRTLHFASLAFDVSFQEIFSTWGSGGALVLVDEATRMNPVALVKALDRLRVNRVFLPFIALQQMAEGASRSGCFPVNLREVNVAGEQLRITPEIVRFFQELREPVLENHYGPTETHVVTAHRIMGAPGDWPHLPPIGQPLPNTVVTVLDSEGVSVPVGVSGEIHIGGIALARGYLNRPDLTDDRFIETTLEEYGQIRLYRTGDLGSVNSDGDLEFLGRIDDQIKIRGVRVEPGEVETTLESAPTVKTAAVVPRLDSGGSAMLVAYLVPEDPGVGLGDLRAFLRERLPEAMVPSRFIELDGLPLTPTGKVDRRSLPERPERFKPAATPIAHPGHRLERLIAEVWARNLDLDEVPVNQSFFDLGGTSVLTLHLVAELEDVLQLDISVTDLFRYPTVAKLAEHIRAKEREDPPEPSSSPGVHTQSEKWNDRAVAIVGMHCRLPGSGDQDEFWENLLNGVDGILHFTREELLEAGISPEEVDDPDYVRARGMIEGADLFDAGFFGYSRREAALMDPQHRIFLESCWSALEHAGYPPDGIEASVGVWGGVSTGPAFRPYLLMNLMQSDSVREHERLPIMLGNGYDYLTTRVSYKLNLRGPSVNVQTACSTSLVAVCQAVESLRRGDCDYAVAGGVSVCFPQRSGYFFRDEAGIESSDGRCRPFDDAGEGTVFGDGVATVVLKRLEDAVRDRDTIHAVIHGVAVNNDGADKISFSAPGVEGQVRVIRKALEDAGFSPESIGYVEAHGTGTQLGDPIEVEGLTRAFGSASGKIGFCALGSVKSNIGHTVSAAGTASLIKTSLSLREGVIPATLYFERPNRRIELSASPFFVASKRSAWPSHSSPRRAGVSSFGFGGTNAHVVLQEPPPPEPSGPGRDHEILLVSCRDEDLLPEAGLRLAQHLESNPHLDFADVAHTTRVGRSEMTHRRAVIAGSRREAIEILQDLSSVDVVQGQSPDLLVQPVFMFPGAGAQYSGMGRDLYRSESVFRRSIDACADVLGPELDLRAAILGGETRSVGGNPLERPSRALPFLFSVEFALSQLWMSWGIRPAALIGHSVGEYAAMCVAGSLSMEDALTLVTARGRLFETLPPGAMTAVPLGSEEVGPYLTPDLSLAVLNGPQSCVVSGPTDAVAKLEDRLAKEDIDARRVHIEMAAHSSMVDGILDEFRKVLTTITLHPPAIPCISNVTGSWITAEEAMDPEYWARHLRGTVRFSEGLDTLGEMEGTTLVEVGPGKILTSLSRVHPAIPASTVIVPSLRHPKEEVRDDIFMARALAKAWASGVAVDWGDYVKGQVRRRVPLPIYPFRRESHLVEPDRAVASRSKRADRPQVPAMEEVERALEHQAVEQEGRGRSQMTRRDRILATLKKLMHELSGIPQADLDPEATFLDMGFDSLFLTQASLGFKKEFGIRITFQQLFDQAPTLSSLASYIDENLADDVEVSGFVPATTSPEPARDDPSRARDLPAAPMEGDVLPAAVAPQALSGEVDPGRIQQLLALQLRSTAELLEALSAPGVPAAAEKVSGVPKPAEKKQPPKARSEVASVSPSSPGPFKPPNRESVGGLTDQQRRFISEFVDRYVQKTSGSKELTQAHREVFADPRAVAGFRRDWKELVYPLTVDRSKGSRMWDMDGNEYIDAVSGFGAIFFGHAPDFVVAAVQEQLHHNLDYGPHSPVAGKIARMICEATGMERAAFCNTGSEAVLAAMRIARTTTGQDQIVAFNGAYHGIFDEVLGWRQDLPGGGFRNVPLAPGIPRSAIENLVLLDYGDPSSLERIRDLGAELAGVLVEPVQSRRPELQPREFLHRLRDLCTELEIPLIFDEVITGFRVHPRGAQGWFGVQADIATYGKVIGGGMPIGVVAGKKLYMDSLDGGTWRYGDDSFPEAGVTYFAGTFIRHPLSLAAVQATMHHMHLHGSDLQNTVNARTTRLAVELNDFFEESGVPIHIVHFGSVFLPRFGGSHELETIFHRLLHYHGLHLWEGRPGFLTTEHSDEDVDRMVTAFRNATQEMIQGGLLHPASGTGRKPDSEGSALREIAMTEPQTELWLAVKMGKDAACAFNEPLRLDLRGRLHRPALERAIRKVVERHEAFRCTVREDQPVFLVHSSMERELPFVDLSELEVEERDGELEKHLYLESGTTFDFSNGPLIRFKLIRLAPEWHALIITVHHIVCDGWSIDIAVRDISQLYDSAVTGQSLALPDPMQLGRYNEIHAERRNSPEIRAMESYWMEQLQPEPPPLDLPTDRPRPPLKTYNGAREVVLLRAPLGHKLKEVGAQRQSTLFTTLLSAFKVLLHKLSGSRDIVVGVPAAGQALLGENSLVAHCATFLPIRSPILPKESFADHLGRLRRLVMDAHENQEYTYGSLVEKLGHRRDPSRVPLISASFNVDPAISGLAFHGLDWTYVPVPRSFAKLDLDLNIIEEDGDLLLELDHNTDLIDTDTARRWLDHFGHLLEQIAENPDRPVKDLEIATPKDRSKLVVWGDRIEVDHEGSLVHELFAIQAERTPDSIAVLFQGREVSYGELGTKADRIAGHLLQRGLGYGNELIGLMLNRSPEMIAALLGILKAGGAYVPLDPSFPDARLDLIMQDAGLAALVTEEGLVTRVPAGVEAITLDELLGAEPSASSWRAVRPDDLAYVIYTSGSTGQPKGVEVPHLAMANFIGSMSRRPGMAEGEGLLAVTTISFDISVLELFLPIIVGGRVILATEEEAGDGFALHRLLSRTRPTLMQATPSMWRMLLDSGWEGSLTKILCGGEAFQRDLVLPLLDRADEAWNLYGPTETTVWSTCHRVRPEDQSSVPIGLPIENTWVAVMDENGRPLPQGMEGELWIGGSGVTHGYRGQEALTAERFISDPFLEGRKAYRTGDLARWRKDGLLEHLGRMDHQVKVHGFRIELGEIEAVLSRHPAVRQAVAMVWGEGPDARLAAYVVPEESGRVLGSEIRAFTRRHLPSYMVPGLITECESFPLTPNGKIDRTALPDPSGQPVARAFSEPRPGEERQIADIWKRLLEVERVGRGDNFFELGGHSLLAMRVVALVKEEAGLVVDPRSLFFMTLEEVAASAIREEKKPSLVP